ILQIHQMIIAPGWSARPIADESEVFLIQVLRTRKRTMDILDHVATCIGLTFQQPAEHATCIFNPTAGGQSELELRSVRQRAFPMLRALLVSDEGTLILAEVRPVAL